MNSKQLFEALDSNQITTSFFDGVYASDQVNDIIIRPQLIIVNTQPSDMPGEHWLAFFFQGNVVDVFDSLGRDLTSYAHASNDLLNFVRRHAFIMNGLKSRTQPPNSDICGQMCLYFAYFRCLGYSLDFIADRMKNIQNVLYFIEKNFQQITITNQQCTFAQGCLKQK